MKFLQRCGDRSSTSEHGYAPEQFCHGANTAQSVYGQRVTQLAIFTVRDRTENAADLRMEW
jgi:hypothetical protein